MFPAFTTKDTMTTTKVPRRGRHGNTDVAFSSPKTFWRGLDPCAPGIIIMISYSRPSPRACAYFITPDDFFFFGDVLRWRVRCSRPPNDNIAAAAAVRARSISAGNSPGVFRLEDFHPSPRTFSIIPFVDNTTCAVIVFPVGIFAKLCRTL